MQTEDKFMLALGITAITVFITSWYVMGDSWQEKKIAPCIFTGEVQPDGRRLYKCPDGFYILAGPNHRNARGE